MSVHLNEIIFEGKKIHFLKQANVINAYLWMACPMRTFITTTRGRDKNLELIKI